MKTSFLIISFLFATIGFAQSQPKLEDYALANSDVNVVVFPFGMDNPVKIGTVSKSGHINFEFPTELPKISKETQENFMNDLAYTLFDVCDDGKDMISDKDNRPSFEAGMLSLATTDHPYAGVITAISDEALMPWITDPGYEEPVLGSYFELIYVTSIFHYEGECVQTRSSMSDDPDMEITYSFNLNLKTGFNFIEYKIENIHETDPEMMASFPDVISVTSVEGIPNCKWIGKYF
ncbi:hypothetical protein [Gelidibacter maritimus]|uniref:Uncharacterized protein n=1 Tax=Gelidibacter maritimus TaxID=2761487 RepID=A0A7W2M5N3_9FLAO|nr:hypothetical protein [Gelidibacter maritimus]MBA6153170.1 hypothetical protein [Gelidibacter maritimus]